MFEGHQYLIERLSWKTRKNDSLAIKGISGNTLGSFAPAEQIITIKDVGGVTQGEVQSNPRWNYSVAVYGPQHTLRGTITLTKPGFTSVISYPSTYEIHDPQGALLAVLKATKADRQQYLLKFKAPDGELVADVHQSSNKGYIQLDVLKPGFDPLLVMADIIYDIARGGVKLVQM